MIFAKCMLQAQISEMRKQLTGEVPSYLTGVLLVFVLELQLEKETLLFERTERAR